MVKEIFASALELPFDERSRFLEEICGADKTLFAEVESLLAAHGDPENLIEKNSFDLAANLEVNGHAFAGKPFGNYKIVREIGRGGMGAVFLAERIDGEFEQQVALKVVRQAFDPELGKRFRIERQILANLNHPRIAKLIDGGVSSTGELFFAMEYVEGEPLLSFAQKRRLGLDDRLRLFLKICSAVSYAHRNLTVHRDIKPSNILVTEDGEPKLLDFGLARISDPNANGVDITQTTFRAFTPAYASPEQIAGKNITTASDVYSLGIVLYELMTGNLPFHFEDKSFDEILRTIEANEPPRPSSNLADDNATDQQPFIAGNPKLLKGDLDTIILKSLRREPEMRYESVERFAQDIERYLRNLPILARPQTLLYRGSRFYRRNRIAVTSVVFIIVALAGGLAATLWQFQNARRERIKSDAVNAFLQRTLLVSNPKLNLLGKQGREITVTDVLEVAEQRLENEALQAEPDVRARLQQIIGTSFLAQGRYDVAERNLRSALAAQIELYGEEGPDTLRTHASLASLLFARADYDGAEQLFEQRLDSIRSEQQKGTIDADVLLLALNDYALLRRARGDSKKAETLLRETLELAPQVPVEARSIVGETETLLILTLLDEGKFDEAEGYARRLVAEYRERANAETPELCDGLTILGSILMERGALTESESVLREGESLYRKLYDQNYVPIFDNIRLQAQNLYLQGRYAEAETKIDAVLENYRQNARPQYISFATALTAKGLIANKVGRSAEAERILREAVQLRVDNLPKGHFMTALTMGALGEVLLSQSRFADAEPFLRTSLADLHLSQTAPNERTDLAQRRVAELERALKK